MAKKKTRVLIVDDEQVVCDLLRDELSERGYLCTTSLRGKEALAKLAAQDFEVVLLDIRLPGMSGMEVLREIWLNHSKAVTIMITAVNDVDTAVLAMKWGASDYIVKPFDLERIDTSIRIALEAKQATKETSTDMDAIAHGVEAKPDPFSTFSGVVTKRTTEIARQLGIAEVEIQRWVAAKTELDARKNKISEVSPDNPE